MSMPLRLAAAPGGAATPALAPALVGAGLIHLFLILAVSFRPPEPSPIPETALEVVILDEPGLVTLRPSADAVLSRMNRIGEAGRPEAAVSGPPDSAHWSEPDAAEASHPPDPIDRVKASAPLAELEPSASFEAQVLVDPPADRRATESVTPASGATSMLVAEADSDNRPPRFPDPLAPGGAQVDAARILASRGREIARLTASLEAKTAAYANRVRRKSVSASTREFRYATYLSAWARKVERIGNLNYPQAAKEQHLYGSLILHVAVRSDGSVERIRVVRSSGYDLLDEAAIQIVELGAPYSPFPPDIAAETDVLDIVRTWQFMRGGVLGWER